MALDSSLKKLGPVTFPFSPVISQKTSYIGTNNHPKANMPTTMPMRFLNVLLVSKLFDLWWNTEGVVRGW